MFRSKLILGLGTVAALGCGFGVLANPAQAHADTVTSTGIEHTVVQGDTLWGLSQKYGVSLQNVYDANNKSETNSFLQIGDQVLIPGTKTAQMTTATTQNTNTNISATVNTSSASTATKASTTAQATQATTSARTTASTASSSSVATPVAQSSSTTATAPAQTTQTASASTNANASIASSSTATTGGSTYSQFIAAGGTSSLWSNVVIPESGGDPSASNGQYHGLGQTAESWGQGSVASQTQGMVNYAVSRYGSIQNAVSFRAQHGWW